MKKTLLSLLAVTLSFTALAQTDSYKISINTNSQSDPYQITGENAVVSAMKHTQDGILQILFKSDGNNTNSKNYEVKDIKDITFSIVHKSDVEDITLADASASEKTKLLYKYLKQNYGKKTISAVIANVNWNQEEADKIYYATGKYPAINCFDFIHIYVPKQGSNGWINYNNITPVTKWADAGGLVSLMWHFNVPIKEGQILGMDGADGNGNKAVTCTPSETTFRAKNVFNDDSWESKWFYQEMDKVANVLLKLQDAGIVAIWRPFHEAAGNATFKWQAGWTTSWFWWGYDGAETYKKLWKTMFDYFQSKGIHNLIWTWTTQNYNGDANSYNNDKDWYPGDKYVDVIGRDIYGYDANKQAQEFKEIQARYPGKLVTLAECGIDTNGNKATANMEEAWNAGAKWSWFMPWYGCNMPSNDWWKNVMNSQYVITRDQVNRRMDLDEERERMRR